MFENLFSNIQKYAQPGTRVYLTCQATDEQVTITFRNISAEPLNISADELMERFVRGDASRNTEGAAWACPSPGASPSSSTGPLPWRWTGTCSKPF
ncbi:MAG: hypothetical protein ACLUNZ_07185 [Evtepia sp.]